jgi:hypothetical protein
LPNQSENLQNATARNTPDKPPGVRFLSDKVDSVSHAAGRSTVTTAAGAAVTGSLVLDATGHSRRLVKFDRKFDPGYQGAYGIIAEVEGHPFDINTMLFMVRARAGGEARGRGGR